MVREIIVIKKPRKDVLPDKPIAFPPLQNLHLELMENKKKLKKNIPLVQVKKPAPAGVPVVKAKPYSAAVMAGTAPVGTQSPVTEKKVSVTEKKVSVTKKDSKKKEAVSEANTEEVGDLENDLEEKTSGNTGAETTGDDANAEAANEDEAGEEARDEAGEEARDEAGEDDDVIADLAEGVATGAAVVGVAKGEDLVENMEVENTPEVPQEEDQYAGLSPEEREAKEKEEYIWRFRILKKQYRSRDIPEFTEHDDIITMKTTYERTLREIGLETNLENYRMYLIGSFMAIEFASTHWMGINLDGFYSQQMLMMDKYDRLLIELGEKSYTRWGSNLPVEVRLLGFVILQAGLFYLGKIIADKAGSSVAELFKNITGQPVAKASTASGSVNEEPEPAPKKKMRGPSVKVADLKKKIPKRDSEES
jgi:hypothetical protein